MLSSSYNTAEHNQVTYTAHKHRQDDNKENETVSSDTLPPTKKPQAYTEQRSNKEKLRDILAKIDNANWSMSDFLYYTFRNKDSAGKDIHQDHSHASTVQKFLARQT
jgi:uncharacterized FlaG/YvyC family protein